MHLLLAQGLTLPLSLRVEFTFDAALGYLKQGPPFVNTYFGFWINNLLLSGDDKNKINWEQQLVMAKDKSSSLIFYNNKFLHKLSDIEEVHIDDTFKMTPKIPEMYQLLRLISVINDEVC